MAAASVEVGQVSNAVALRIEPTSEHTCLPPVDAAAPDGGEDAPAHDAPARPEGGLLVDASPPDGACGAGLTSCGTACIPTAGCCVSAQCPLRANATRSCNPETHDCGYLCMNGHHACGDECVRDDAVETCGDRCVACDAPKGGFVTCNGAASRLRLPAGPESVSGPASPSSRPARAAAPAARAPARTTCAAPRT